MRAAPRRLQAAGVTLVELLLAMALTLIIAGIVALVAAPVRLDFKTRLEATDVEQRLRTARDTLAPDLLMAGAGAYAGTLTGPLVDYLPPILPLRLGVDAPGTVRDDGLTVLYVPSTAAQTVLAQPLVARTGPAVLADEPGCSAGDASCGFAAGMRVLVYDNGGAFDLFAVESVLGNQLALRHELPDSGQVYAAGSKIVAVVVRIYDIDPGDADSGPQLMRDEGSGQPQPVVDHLVRLHVEYDGDPLPPAALAPADDPMGPWTTYGPRPPPPGVTIGAWPAGENCVFARDPATGQPRPRTDLAVLGSEAGPLVPLAPAMLGDGPWCPDASAVNRFDADLLRIRRLRITIRAESALDALRGPASLLFSRGGHARSARALVPDRELYLVMAPRNVAGIR